MLAHLVELVREHTDIFNDEKTLRQMLTFVKKDGGVQEAEEGYHDDKVMSLAIAYQARNQVSFINEPIYVDPQYSFDADRRASRGYDYGERIRVI
jgi:phage terminase large subunit